MKLIVSASLVCALLLGCAEDLTVEQQVIATLRNMEAAAESGEHFDFMEFVADDFVGQLGAMDKNAFHRFMLFQMNQHRRLQAQFFPIHVLEEGENQARAKFRLLVTGGGGLLPDRGKLFEVNTSWLMDGDDWQLTVANWEPVQLPDIPDVIDHQ